MKGLLAVMPVLLFHPYTAAFKGFGLWGFSRYLRCNVWKTNGIVTSSGKFFSPISYSSCYEYKSSLVSLLPSCSNQCLNESRNTRIINLNHSSRVVSLRGRPCVMSRFKSTQSKTWGPLKGSKNPNDESSGASDKGSKTRPPKKKKGSKKVKLQRLTKVLADRGLGTRSQVFELAKAKRITIADSSDAPHEERRRLRGPSEQVPYDANLFLDGKLIPGPTPLVLVYHKPKFVLSVMEDDKKYLDQQRKHLGHVLEPRYIRSGMHPVGRLDYDTTGLILFSSDGKLTQALLHPKRGIEKEYVATVQGMVDKERLEKLLSEGIETTEGVHSAKLIEITCSDGPRIEDFDGEAENNHEMNEGDDNSNVEDFSAPHSDIRLVVTEGKYRMVRRMLANCGHPVVELRRERHGKVLLKDLPVGEFRKLSQDEMSWIESLM